MGRGGIPMHWAVVGALDAPSTPRQLCSLVKTYLCKSQGRRVPKIQLQKGGDASLRSPVCNACNHS